MKLKPVVRIGVEYTSGTRIGMGDFTGTAIEAIEFVKNKYGPMLNKMFHREKFCIVVEELEGRKVIMTKKFNLQGGRV